MVLMTWTGVCVVSVRSGTVGIDDLYRSAWCLG